MNNNLFNAFKFGAQVGGNQAINKNKGCRNIYDVSGIVVGLLFVAIGLGAFSANLLGGGFALIFGLLLIIVFAKDIKQ